MVSLTHWSLAGLVLQGTSSSSGANFNSLFTGIKYILYSIDYLWEIIFWRYPVKLPSCGCYMMLWIMSQHQFKLWLGQSSLKSMWTKFGSEIWHHQRTMIEDFPPPWIKSAGITEKICARKLLWNETSKYWKDWKCASISVVVLVILCHWFRSTRKPLCDENPVAPFTNMV